MLDKLNREGELRHSHPFHMWDAIMETPDVVRDCLQGRTAEIASGAGRELAARRIRRVFLLGCGTSNYAAHSTAHALADLAGIDADAYDAFEFGQYRLGLVRPGTAAIAFSHSGATKVTVDAARVAREAGAFTIALTDFEDSLLARESDLHVPVGGGREPVEPKTRSYVNTVVAAYQIAIAAGEAAGTCSCRGRVAGSPKESLGGLSPREALGLIPSALKECLALEPGIRDLAEKYAKVKRVFVVGGGPNCATATEIALKFKEAVLLAGEGSEVEEAFHGPIASLGEDTLVIGVSVPGPSYDKVGYFLKAATRMGNPAICVTSEPYDLHGVDTIKVSLGRIPEVLSSAVMVYPLYMLAYYSALVRGNNPDRFRVGDAAFHEAMASVPSVTYRQSE